jgi:hypothetical protein
MSIYLQIANSTNTYDHRFEKIRDPVRSPLVKLGTGRLVVGSVTTSESLLLYVFFLAFFLFGIFLVLSPFMVLFGDVEIFVASGFLETWLFIPCSFSYSGRIPWFYL